MTTPIQPPPRKDPQKRTRVPVAPPDARSRAALGLSVAAARGRFMLQVCNECSAVQYPPRDACSSCLSVDLDWQVVSSRGRLVAKTIVRTSTHVYFRERTPWRVGTVRLDCGPAMICHIHGDCAPRDNVRVINRLDKSGHGVLFAVPEKEMPAMEDDPQLRELTCSPKFRRILITDTRSESGQALARSFSEAGASIVFAGEAESWRHWPERENLQSIANVELVPLDVSDTQSVEELCGEIGGKVDILVNNARFVRPGGVVDGGNLVFAQQEMEVNCLGLMRLAQAFGPVMRGRGADGVNSATAWVNIMSVYAYCNLPPFGTYSASSAAAHSLSQCLRSELRAGGVRVMNVYTSPIDDEWHQPLPPPKVDAVKLSAAVIEGLQEGLEEVYVGDVAEDLIDRWAAGPKLLELEMTRQGGA